MSEIPDSDSTPATPPAAVAGPSNAEYTDKSILIFDPSSGDGIQHLKGGTLEVCDEIIVSKKDIIPGEAIIQSLKEWTSNQASILNANLTDQNSLQGYFESNFLPEKKLDPKALVNIQLKNSTQKFFREQLDQFLNDSGHKGSISELSTREFRTNFINFLKRNT